MKLRLIVVIVVIAMIAVLGACGDNDPNLACGAGGPCDPIEQQQQSPAPEQAPSGDDGSIHFVGGLVTIEGRRYHCVRPGGVEVVTAGVWCQER